MRVIVLLNAPAIAAPGKPDAAAIASIKTRVAALQDAVLARHFGDAVNLRPGRGFTRLHTRFPITPGFVVNVDAAELEALAADPQVKSIHIDHARPPTLLQSLPLIGQPAAYSNGATGSGWAVTVLDTGVQSNHEFLSGKVVAEACFSNAGGNGGGVSLCPNGQSSQSGTGSANSTTANCINGSTNLCQHGTHVSGIAAGLQTNPSSGKPTNGVAPGAKIFAIQIFTRFNDTSSCSPGSPPCVASYDSDQVSALDYVYQHLTPVAGVNVASVNMSLGGGPNTSTACDSDIQKTPIDNLRAAGVLTAIAAGNDGSTSQISHPACISSAVAVGSTTKSDAVSSFSNMASIVALLAPGGFGGGSCSLGGNNPDILSSFPGTSSGTTNLYACEAGTSMATPHVAGAIAALRTIAPNATAAQILSALQSTGISVTDTRSGGTITKPRIRLDLAAQALNSNEPTLQVSPIGNIATSGEQLGPFTPASFPYRLSTNTGSVGFSITGVPSWLTPSATSGTVTTSGITVTFTVNSTPNNWAIGTYGPTTITFTNTTNGLGNDTRTATLTVTSPPPPNDNFANATTLQAGQTVTGSNVGATFETGETEHNAQFPDSGGASVWWRFVAPVSGTFTVNTCGSSFDTVLAVYTGNAINALTLVAGNDDAASGPCSGTNQSYVSFNAVAGTAYSIVVDGYNGGSGAATGTIQLALSAGPSATLVVTPLTDMAASGNPDGPFSPPSFQYQLNASIGSATYSITGIPGWLTASSTSGTLTTSATTLTFTVNSTANGLAPGVYNAVIGFTNTSNGQGNQTRNATLTVNSGGGGAVSQVYVSPRTGADSGLCPVTAPCATLNYALSVSGAGGRITIVDGGVFGPIVLTKAITIAGIDPHIPFQIAADPAAQVGCVGALPSGCALSNHGFAAEIAAGVSDTVTLTNLQMLAGSYGAGALKLTSGGIVQLSENVYRGNAGATSPIIALYPNNPGTTQVQVYFSSSDIGFNGADANAGALEVKPSGNTSLKLHFNHCDVHNASYGIRADSTLLSGPSVNIAAAISESEFFSFANAAASAISATGKGTLTVAVDGARVLNANVAVQASGNQSTVILTGSTISGNGTGVLVQNGAQVFTSQSNTIAGNGTDISGGLTSSPPR